VQTSTGIKTLWVMQDVCWNFLKPAISIPDSACTEHTSSQQQVAGMQLCSGDVLNFLLIVKMQQHDSAWEPGLHFAASPNALGRVQNVLELSLLSIYLVLMSRSSKIMVPLSNQGIVRQSESTILLGMRFPLDLATKRFGERSRFLSYKALNFSSNA